jgi:hypothetical protein
MIPSRTSGLMRGAYFHYCNRGDIQFDQATISNIITFGNRSAMNAENVRKIRSCVLEFDGKK